MSDLKPEDPKNNQWLQNESVEAAKPLLAAQFWPLFRKEQPAILHELDSYPNYREMTFEAWLAWKAKYGTVPVVTEEMLSEAWQRVDHGFWDEEIGALVDLIMEINIPSPESEVGCHAYYMTQIFVTAMRIAIDENV